MINNFLSAVALVALITSCYGAKPSSHSTGGRHAPSAAAREQEGFASENRERIRNGIDAGVALAEAVKEGEFKESLQKIATKLASFLGALGPLASIFLTFISSGDSEELKFMKEEFKKVHNKLDVISAEFQEVKDAIDWNSVTVSYGDYERRILAAEANLNQIYEREGAAREQQKEHFIRQFDYHFGNSLQSLYDATMRENLLFSPNILDAVVTQTKNHKKKFEQFSLGLVQLLIQGLMVRISYHAMKGEETEDLVEHWNANMIRLKQKLQKTSDEIKNAYLDQLKSDVPDIIRRSPELDNRELRNKIYQFLNEKYDWRYFFVAVYDDYTGDDKHYVSVCGGDTFRTPNEKNVVVASQDKSLEARNHRSFARWSLVLGVAQNAKSCGRGNFDSQTSARRSKVLVENLMALSDSKCSPNQLYMAVEIHDEFHSSNPNGHRDMRRITQKRLCNCRPHFGLYLCDEVYWNHMIIAFG